MNKLTCGFQSPQLLLSFSSSPPPIPWLTLSFSFFSRTVTHPSLACTTLKLWKIDASKGNRTLFYKYQPSWSDSPSPFVDTLFLFSPVRLKSSFVFILHFIHEWARCPFELKDNKEWSNTRTLHILYAWRRCMFDNKMTHSSVMNFPSKFHISTTSLTCYLEKTNGFNFKRKAACCRCCENSSSTAEIDKQKKKSPGPVHVKHVH